MKVRQLTDDFRVNDSYAMFGTMTWPRAGRRADDLQWRLRYAPEITKEDRLHAASIICAYYQMVRDKAVKRSNVVKHLRLAETLDVLPRDKP